MLATLRSAFLMGALEYIVLQGVTYCEMYTEEKEQEVEAFVKNLIPGEDFDVLGWGFVKSLMPKVFEMAKELASKIDGVEGPVRTAMMFQAAHNLLKA
jgi:hypothetical protein